MECYYEYAINYAAIMQIYNILLAKLPLVVISICLLAILAISGIGV